VSKIGKLTLNGDLSSAKQKRAHKLNGTSARNRNNDSRSRKTRAFPVNLSKDLWISPTLNLRGKHGDRAWDRSGNLPPGAGMRLLELADIALGLKKPTLQKNHGNSQAHQTSKSEPYSV
jgi:hypothetical protein